LTTQIDNKIFKENEQFWNNSLKDNFEAMTISELKEMHNVMMSMKQVFEGKKIDSKNINEEEPSAESSSKNDNNLDLLFSTESGPQQPVEENMDLEKSGLEGLEDLF
jgi:hypothetical protein